MYPIDKMPTDEELSTYITSPLYEDLCKYLSVEFNAKRSVELSLIHILCCGKRRAFKERHRKMGKCKEYT